MILLIVFIHQLLCIENTKEQLPDMNFCHPLQENISSLRGGGLPPPDPLLTGSLFLATPLTPYIIGTILALVLDVPFSDLGTVLVNTILKMLEERRKAIH